MIWKKINSIEIPKSNGKVYCYSINRRANFFNFFQKKLKIFLWQVFYTVGFYYKGLFFYQCFHLRKVKNQMKYRKTGKLLRKL